MLALSFPFLTSKSYAQITTSSLSGKIVNEKGESIPGCTVIALNNSTGTKYGITTNVDGLYNIQNMNVGGPYTITITYIGMKPQKKENVYLNLGNTMQIDFTMSEANIDMKEVQIVADKYVSKNGTTTNINRDNIQSIPTISRSIQDFTKVDPRNTNNSYAGSNFRYNNITLDGAINNDAIGFSPSLGGVSGTSNMPGSSTRSNPISLDAIEDIQTTIAPFDVRLGNFTGGSVNAVTKSGTNTIHGSIYGYGRNQTITGKMSSESSESTKKNFYDYQTGISLGFPVIKNKLFVFVCGEIARRKEPVFYAAGQDNSIVSAQLASKIDSFLTSRYNYSPGSSGDYNISSNSNKIFARVDWNINNKNTLTLRTNYLNSQAGNLERSQNIFKFASQDFIQHNNQSSTVLELKSRSDKSISNNFIAGFTSIHDYRSLVEGAQIFPAIQINNVGSGTNFTGSGQMFLGTDREASIFNLHQTTIEITDNLSYFLGIHNFTLGTHNELYNIKYGFINSWNGRIEYNNVSDFLADKPNRIRGTYNNGTSGDNSHDYNYNNPSADFNILLTSAYLQDEMTLGSKFKLTAGIRLDMPIIPSKPDLSPLVPATSDDPNLGNTFTHTSWSQFDNKILGNIMVSPRIGFSWDITGKQNYVIRGGTGIFTGRIPFAWIGYAYYNNGINFNSVDLNNIQRTPYPSTGNIYTLNSDPNVIYNQLPAGNKSTTEVNLIDNGFKMPTIWRSSLSADLKIPGDIKITIEGMFTKTIYDVKFQNINLKDSVRYCSSGPSELPIYLSGGATANKVNKKFSNVYLLSNTNKGYKYSLTFQAQKTFKFGLDLMAAYTFGESFDISNGIRNSMQSNWELNPALNPNDPGLAYSNFDIRHKVVATASFRKSWNKNFTSYLSVFFSGQSGNPFTYVYNNNFTGNGQQNVILAYIPSNKNEINLVANGTSDTRTPDQIWTELDNYISNNNYLNTRRGKYTERNAARTPWNYEINLRIMQDFNVIINKTTHTFQLSFDLLNVANLINKEWGQFYFVPNTNNSCSAFGLTQKSFDANGNPNFTFVTPTTKPYSVDQLASRWQAQIGLRYKF